MSKNLKVAKNNALVAASYRFTLTEMQIILYGIGLINPTSPNFPLIYQIKIKEFSELFNRDHRQIYGEIKKTIFGKLWERDFSYVDKDGKVVTTRWLTRIRHDDETGFIEIKFSEEIQPYLHQLQKNFTTYYIDKISKFKSFYSIRFYEVLIMHLNRSKKDICEFIESIEDIKKMLMLEGSYERFYNIKERVIEKAKSEINKHSDISFDYEVIKVGREPKEIKFTVKRKEATNDKPSPNNKRLQISTVLLEQAKKLIIKAKTGWDVYHIEQEFYAYAKNAGLPNNIEGAFIGFVKKKIAKPA